LWSTREGYEGKRILGNRRNGWGEPLGSSKIAAEVAVMRVYDRSRRPVEVTTAGGASHPDRKISLFTHPY
jgi:hypothetical protein